MIRRFRDMGIFVLVLIAVAALVRYERAPLVLNLDLRGVTQAEALEAVVQASDIQVLLGGPDKEDYTYDFDLRGLTVEEAIGRLHLEPWKLLEGILVLTPSYESIMECHTRMEFLLEEAPSEILLPHLRRAFPETRFVLHPTMNGFFASGSKESLLSLKRFLGQVDRSPVEPIPDIERDYQARYLSAEELSDSLRCEFPDVVQRIEAETIHFQGSLSTTGEAYIYLDLIDRDQVEHEVSLQELRSAKQTCRYHGSFSLRVDCPEGCQGPLQILGLRNNDFLENPYRDELKSRPEWHIKRDGRPTRIILRLAP